MKEIQERIPANPFPMEPDKMLMGNLQWTRVPSGGVTILLVAPYMGYPDELWLDGLLGTSAD